MRESNIHRLFEVSVALKGLHALLELMTGAAILALSPVGVANFFLDLAQREQAQGAPVFIADFLLALSGRPDQWGAGDRLAHWRVVVLSGGDGGAGAPHGVPALSLHPYALSCFDSANAFRCCRVVARLARVPRSAFWGVEGTPLVLAIGLEAEWYAVCKAVTVFGKSNALLRRECPRDSVTIAGIRWRRDGVCLLRACRL